MNALASQRIFAVHQDEQKETELFKLKENIRIKTSSQTKLAWKLEGSQLTKEEDFEMISQSKQ